VSDWKEDHADLVYKCQALAEELQNSKRRTLELEKRVQNLEAVLKLAQTLLGLD
jgi:hypothetical protein